MLSISNFYKSYTQGKPVVKGLSLTVEDGDIFGFIGHNGAGKTTTIKAIAGILPFDSGEIVLNGVSIKADPISFKKQMAYLPDNPDLYENMSGIKYINFIADLFGVEAGKRRENIEKFASAFELYSELGNPISSYSHGMKQKLALIAAFVHEPRFMIMDEPFVGLDPKASHTVKAFMRELCEKGGSIFFSTHVLEVAEKLCNKIGIIKDGSLIRYGDIEEVRGDSSLEDIFLELV